MLCHHGVKNPPARRTIGLDDPSSPGSSSSLPDPRSTQASYSKKVSVERGPVPSRPQQKKPSPSHSDSIESSPEFRVEQVRASVLSITPSLSVGRTHRASCRRRIYFVRYQMTTLWGVSIFRSSYVHLRFPAAPQAADAADKLRGSGAVRAPGYRAGQGVLGTSCSTPPRGRPPQFWPSVTNTH